MSIDVEEYFQVSAFEKYINRGDWRSMQSRLTASVDRILQLLDDAGARATFFTLGWIAKQRPEIVRSIVAAGHELASHGYDHRRVWSLTPKQFLRDISTTKLILEDISGQRVKGYRAPSFSITENTPWAYDKMQESGYEYSSSIYPISHDHYGSPDAPRFPYRQAGNNILEIPLTTSALIGRNLPAAGGGYFRLLPLTYSRWALRRVNSKDRMPAVFYFHPWELDPEQPRVSGIRSITRFRHYVSLDRFEGRLKNILTEFNWDRLDQVFRKTLEAP